MTKRMHKLHWDNCVETDPVSIMTSCVCVCLCRAALGASLAVSRPSSLICFSVKWTKDAGDPVWAQLVAPNEELRVECLKGDFIWVFMSDQFPPKSSANERCIKALYRVICSESIWLLLSLLWNMKTQLESLQTKLFCDLLLVDGWPRIFRIYYCIALSAGNAEELNTK